jgi:hypothetical protein
MVSNPGPGVDRVGNPVDDPTKNVMDLVEAAIKRQDDLRAVEGQALRREVELRAEYDEKLRRAETERIDAIRAVDVGAVNRAAEVAATVAATLAAQLAATAEASRVQVAAAAQASVTSLAAALEPIQKDIRDLRDSQNAIRGGKEQTGETRLNVGSVFGIIAGVVGVIGLILVVVLR